MSDLLNVKSRLKQQEKLDDKEQQQLNNDIKKVFDTPEGRRVLHKILSICELYSDCFTGNAQTYYLEGKRVVGLEVLEMIMEADKEIYIKLLRENYNAG